MGSSSSHSNNGNTHGHITPTTVCYEYSYPDSNSNHSKSGFLRPLSEHHYEQPMVVLPPSQSPSDSLGKIFHEKYISLTHSVRKKVQKNSSNHLFHKKKKSKNIDF